jgi:hypothetical protein
MTDSDSLPTTAASKKSSSSRMIIIIVLAVVVLAGGAFVIYKLTNKKDSGVPAAIVAMKVKNAVTNDNQVVIAQYTTAEGKVEVAALKGKADSLVFGKCDAAPSAKVTTKVCTFTRPGGQLSLVLVQPNGKWLVSSATLGPTGVTPTASSTTSTPSTSTTT